MKPTRLIKNLLIVIVHHIGLKFSILCTLDFMIQFETFQYIVGSLNLPLIILATEYNQSKTHEIV
jgi:hypothetical protein